MKNKVKVSEGKERRRNSGEVPMMEKGIDVINSSVEKVKFRKIVRKTLKPKKWSVLEVICANVRWT